jgi:hypothetical protein
LTNRSVEQASARAVNNKQPMRQLLSVSWIAGVLIAAVAVAGCSGGSQTQPTANAQLLRRSASWMAPGSAKRDLLYLSDDGDGNVYVYSFPMQSSRGR